jgi:dihydrofolate reductase
MKPKCSVYMGSSLDGFIAREDGGIDWLDFDSADDSGPGSSGTDDPGSEDSDSEDYGFAEFMESVDMLLMGRHTFELVLTFDEWVYGDTHLTVLSSTLGPEAIPAHMEGRVSITSGDPAEILEDLAEKGVQHVYVDGGITVQEFIAAGLIDEITIGIIPILIGDGIPLFGPLEGDVRLQHVATRSFPSGLVQVKYKTLA